MARPLQKQCIQKKSINLPTYNLCAINVYIKANLNLTDSTLTIYIP